MCAPCVSLSIREVLQKQRSTSIFVKFYFRNRPQTEDGNSCFIDDNNLKIYSSTYKILHGNLQQIFSDDSASDADDAGTQKTTKNEGNDILQGQSKIKNHIQRCKKPNFVSNCIYEFI